VLTWRAVERGAPPSMLRRTAVSADPWQDFLQAEASGDGAAAAAVESGGPALARADRDSDRAASDGSPVLATARAEERDARAAPAQVRSSGTRAPFLGGLWLGGACGTAAGGAEGWVWADGRSACAGGGDGGGAG
jgi:hypothetical protein